MVSNFIRYKINLSHENTKAPQKTCRKEKYCLFLQQIKRKNDGKGKYKLKCSASCGRFQDAFSHSMVSSSTYHRQMQGWYGQSLVLRKKDLREQLGTWRSSQLAWYRPLWAWRQSHHKLPIHAPCCAEWLSATDNKRPLSDHTRNRWEYQNINYPNSFRKTLSLLCRLKGSTTLKRICYPQP